MRAFDAAAAVGDSNGMLALAFCLRERGLAGAAERVVEEAAATGNLAAGGVLACWMWDRTHDLSLEAALRVGAEHYSSARASLAALLRDTGRLGEARQVLERGVALGEAESCLPLGNLLLDELGEVSAAEKAYRSGIAAGDAYSHHNLALLLESKGEDVAAAEQWRLGADAGDSLATRALSDRRGP